MAEEQVPVYFETGFAKMIGKAREHYRKETTVPFDEKWLFEPSNVYNPGLSCASMGLALSGYKNWPSNGYQYILKTMAAFGFEDIDITSFYHRNKECATDFRDSINLVSVAFGHRVISDGAGASRTLVVAMVRGTSHTREWDSNADVADYVTDGDYRVDYHAGFLASAQEALEQLRRYTRKHAINDAEATLWIMGQSRGAAVANVMSGLLDDGSAGLGFVKERIYSYQFACSFGTTRADAQGAAFDNIFNIDNPEDYIPRLPLRAWGFTRFGRDLYFPSVATSWHKYQKIDPVFQQRFREFTNTTFPGYHGFQKTNHFIAMAGNISPTLAQMYEDLRYTREEPTAFSEYFRLFCDSCGKYYLGLAHDLEKLLRHTGGPFDHFAAYFAEDEVIHPEAPAAHDEEGYLARTQILWALGIMPDERDATDTRRVTVYGEVDVEARDGAGEVHARIVNGACDESLYAKDGYYAMYAHKPTLERSVWLPDDEDAELSLTARADGAYDLFIERQDCEGHTLARDLYEDVPLKKGDPTLLSALLAVRKPVCVDAEKFLRLGVEIAGGEGPRDMDAMGAVRALRGDHVGAFAYYRHILDFEGWYEREADGMPGSKAISHDPRVFMRLDKDHTLVAKFR